MHHLDAYKNHRVKARQELHKNTVCCFEQILEATPNKTAVVWTLTSHLTDNPSKTNKTLVTAEVQTYL